MNAIDLLKKQHDKVAELFERFEKASKPADKSAIFEEIAANLVAHDAIEREIFYPACEKKMGLTDLLGEALVEHGVVEFMLYRTDENLGKEALDHHVTVLQEVVDHHVEEEEKELFPKVEKAFSKAALEEFGPKMWARFQEAIAADFRGPLAENLSQVLAGAMKTKPPKKKKTARKAPAAKRPVVKVRAPKKAPSKSNGTVKKAKSKSSTSRHAHA